MSSDDARAVLDAIDGWSNDDRPRHGSHVADDAMRQEHVSLRDIASDLNLYEHDLRQLVLGLVTVAL